MNARSICTAAIFVAGSSLAAGVWAHDTKVQRSGDDTYQSSSAYTGSADAPRHRGFFQRRDNSAMATDSFHNGQDASGIQNTRDITTMSRGVRDQWNDDRSDRRRVLGRSAPSVDSTQFNGGNTNDNAPSD